MVTQLKLQLTIKGVKQSEIADAAGVSRAYVNRIVHNKQKCSIKVAKALKDAGLDIEGLI